jgi:hypothetical protein
MTSGGALLLAFLSQSPVGAAAGAPDAAPTKARLELRGAGDCLTRGDVTARVASRSARIQFADDAPITASVALTSARAGNVVAELALTAPGAEPAPRRIVAQSCAEAADAVALIIAVTLDPTLRRKPADGAGGASSTGEGGVAATPPAAPVTPTDQAAAKPPAPPETVESPASPPAAPSAPAQRQFGAYLAGQTIFGPAPAVMPGVALQGMAALDRDGVWAPALFVGATRVWRSVSEPSGTASFTLAAASVDACPLRVGSRQLAARPCASAFLGRMSSSGTNTDQAGSAARFFGTAGVALTGTATVGSILDLYARLAIGVTLLRDAYEFDAETFHRAAAITTSASLGAGVHWP